MKKFGPDIAFIVLLGVLLVVLSETDQLDVFMRFPFITILVAYALGRFVGGYDPKGRPADER